MDYLNYLGLSPDQVLENRKKYGTNSLPEKKGPSLVSIYFSQYKNPLVYILLFAAVISAFFKEFTDLALIGSVIFLNSLLGFYQEYNAQKTLNSLRTVLKPQSLVIRNGKRELIETKDLVPGDLVILASGDKIPADGILLESHNFFSQEAILTGEEEPIEKFPGSNPPASDIDKKALLYMGTTVLSGKGLMRVLKIGSQTEIGKINQSLITIKEEKTGLQKKLEDFSKNIAHIVLIVCALIFLLGLLNNLPFWQMFKMSVVLSVSSIPEGLPIAVTVILSLGMRRILKKNGLVKRLVSVETLSSVSVICTDKTGTLTEGIMKVVTQDYLNKEKMLQSITLANNQKTNMEICLWKYVEEQNLFDPYSFASSSKNIYEESFSSEKKYSLTVSIHQNKTTGYLLGAPEIILEYCLLSPEDKIKYLEKIDAFAKKGLRMLAAAYKENGDLKEKKDYLFLGFVGIEDPLRPAAKEALIKAWQAGIQVKIVTGDYLPTALKIAADLGFIINPENIIEGKELETITPSDLEKRINKIIIFARISPHHKLKIVKALQASGEVVAMVGDGVNDALALKKADIGISVSSAADVSREVADLILLDNNFKTITVAIREGRLILSNIKKVVGYVLSNSFEEVTLIFASILLHLPLPLTVVQILWINLICDGPPDITLGFEKSADHLMREKPQKIRKESIFDNSLKFMILAVSLTNGLVALFFFYNIYLQSGNLLYARSVVFSSFGLASLVYIFSFKNLKKSLFTTPDFWENKLLILSVIYGISLLIVAFYLPPFTKILGLTPLSLLDWTPAVIISTFSLFWIELIKYINNHKFK